MTVIYLSLSNPQYGLSQARYTSSDSKLLPPTRMPGPGQIPATRGLRPPQATSGLVRPSYSSGLRPPSSIGRGERKLSGIARPTPISGGIPRPGQSRLQAPGQYQRRGAALPRMTGARGRETGGNSNWMEDCYWHQQEENSHPPRQDNHQSRHDQHCQDHQRQESPPEPQGSQPSCVRLRAINNLNRHSSSFSLSSSPSTLSGQAIKIGYGSLYNNHYSIQEADEDLAEPSVSSSSSSSNSIKNIASSSPTKIPAVSLSSPTKILSSSPSTASDTTKFKSRLPFSPGSYRRQLQ